jgi:parvulin-like peptidyl-prolyl isomerase
MGKPQNKKPAGKEDNASTNKGSALKGGKVTASHILVKKLSLAQQILDDLQSGSDFGEMAKKYSECTSRNKSGNLGPISKDKVVAEFWDAAVKLRIGEISQPVKSQFGYHIIKRTG